MIKKVVCAIFIVVILFSFVACGESVSAEGAWYTPVDGDMYKFENGYVVYDGLPIGEYVADGDSVVLSLYGQDSMQCYITYLEDGSEVLAEVKEGEGLVYFCRDLNVALDMQAE